jgi:hypothetical protein
LAWFKASAELCFSPPYHSLSSLRFFLRAYKVAFALSRDA